MNNIQILNRLYKDYTKKYLKKYLVSFFLHYFSWKYFSVAYLLDPAIKQLFIEQKEILILLSLD